MMVFFVQKQKRYCFVIQYQPRQYVHFIVGQFADGTYVSFLLNVQLWLRYSHNTTYIIQPMSIDHECPALHLHEKKVNILLVFCSLFLFVLMASKTLRRDCILFHISCVSNGIYS